MPYFNYLPDIKYDTKPISYPFSESDFVVAKNFFRRFKLSEEFQQYAVFFRQYQICQRKGRLRINRRVSDKLSMTS